MALNTALNTALQTSKTAYGFWLTYVMLSIQEQAWLR